MSIISQLKRWLRAKRPTRASLPLMITQKMRATLLQRGYTHDEIRNLTPAQAWDCIQKLRPPQSWYDESIEGL